jgi:hypothetical protein
MTQDLETKTRKIEYTGPGITVYDMTIQEISCGATGISFIGPATVEISESKVDIAEEVEDVVIVLKVVPVEDAKKLIVQYVVDHPGIRTSDIITDLGLDVDLVLRCLDELKAEEMVQPREETA